MLGILDCHHHVLDRAHPPAADQAGRGSATPADPEVAARVNRMDGAGVQQAIVIPGHSYLRPRGLIDTGRVNDQIAAYRDGMPSRFPVAVGVVEPLYGGAGIAEIIRCKRELSLGGISFHARLQGVSMDDQWVRVYIEKMAELELVPVVHAHPESPEEALWKTAAIASRMPQIRFLILDTFASLEGAKQCVDAAERCPNLLFDCALAAQFDRVEEAIRRIGAHRVLFGSNLYSPPAARPLKHLVERATESNLSDDEKQLIMGENARMLFNLSQKL
jgi:predicted TIM-barrel fold metal-dependent hydrolase